MKFKITDDSGFLAIVNSETYNSFVKEDWELDLLFNHFINEINKSNITMWKTSNTGGGVWNVNFINEKSEKKSIREFSSILKVTNGKIHLTNFEDLTMCASFPKYKIPLKHNSELFYELENGLYEITVRQFLKPDNSEVIDLHFEIVCKLKKEQNRENNFRKIMWNE